MQFSGEDMDQAITHIQLKGPRQGKAPFVDFGPAN